MENAKISSYQLFILILIFVIGTTVIFPLASDAKQAAWISILLGMFCGLPLLIIYCYLNRIYPDLLLTEYCKKILGKYIGSIIGIFYILFFLYGASRDLRDIMELAPLFLEGTPISAIGIIFMLPILYGLFLGIEVISRTGEAFFLYLVITGVLMIIFLLFSDAVKFENLLPVLEPGWDTIIHTTINEPWMAPFGEIICFTMIFAYLKKPKSQIKVGMAGVISGGLALVFIHLLTISVLGEFTRNQSIAPLLKMVQKINIADFIERVDPLFLIWLVVNDFFKVLIFMYAAVIGGATIFKRSKNILIIPFGLITFFTSIFFAESYTSHMAQSDIVLKYVYPIFSVYIPLLLCIVCFVRQKINKIG
ncbi:GerAB/ArcD/ProY family transporter [Peribacillus simplex]|uniref:GerAB/ArcD/ProY family transporter n=2 Tax=Peribacillus TaxID=2675229 RepID=A0AA90PJY7_9BACI|nr:MULTISPECIES: GerAB/ArcD/ProY family transporter [Peribacillus]MDP1420135.1 GerAB/ArcD/ProY family transporter [Peribacillus simplex]MDP1453775.1 GerAB/ArcD/ProY family transporter [Peribacillus frigoritolerans]